MDAVAELASGRANRGQPAWRSPHRRPPAVGGDGWMHVGHRAARAYAMDVAHRHLRLCLVAARSHRQQLPQSLRHGVRETVAVHHRRRLAFTVFIHTRRGRGDRGRCVRGVRNDACARGAGDSARGVDVGRHS